jgi:hypothetical protein
MISIKELEKLLEKIQEELALCKKITYHEVLSILKKEAEEATHAELLYKKTKNCVSNTYDLVLFGLESNCKSAVAKYNEWKENPPLSSKCMEDEIAIKEKMCILIRAEIAKIQEAEATMAEA